MAEIGAALGWVDPEPPAPLPAARAVLPWWSRLLLWFLEPPPVRPLELHAGPAEVTLVIPGGPEIDDIVRAVLRLHGGAINADRVLAVAQRLRVAGATIAEVTDAIERVQRMAAENMRGDLPPEGQAPRDVGT